MSFKFPPEEVFKEMLSMLSREDIDQVRENYQKEVLEDEIRSVSRKIRKSNLGEFVDEENIKVKNCVQDKSLYNQTGVFDVKEDTINASSDHELHYVELLGLSDLIKNQSNIFNANYNISEKQSITEQNSNDLRDDKYNQKAA